MSAFRKVLCAVDVGDGPGPFLGEVAEERPPARAILDAAERIGADLIVLGNSGAKGQRRLLLGSTAVEVVRDARAAVLVIRLS